MGSKPNRGCSKRLQTCLADRGFKPFANQSTILVFPTGFGAGDGGIPSSVERFPLRRFKRFANRRDHVIISTPL